MKPQTQGHQDQPLSHHAVEQVHLFGLRDTLSEPGPTYAR